MPMPTPPQRPVGEPRPMPVDVGTACQLWCGVLILGIVSAVTSMAVMWRDRQAFVDRLMDQMPEMSGSETLTRDDFLALIPFGLGAAAVGSERAADIVAFLDAALLVAPDVALVAVGSDEFALGPGRSGPAVFARGHRCCSAGVWAHVAIRRFSAP